MGFLLGAFGVFCGMWMFQSLKLVVALLELVATLWFLFFDLFAIGMFCLLWMGVRVCCGFRHNIIAHGQNLFWKWSSTLLVMFVVFVICFCNWAFEFFCEIVMLENLVLQFKFSSFVVHWSSSFMHFAFLWIAKCFF